MVESRVQRDLFFQPQYCYQSLQSLSSQLCYFLPLTSTKCDILYHLSLILFIRTKHQNKSMSLIIISCHILLKLVDSRLIATSFSFQANILNILELKIVNFVFVLFFLIFISIYFLILDIRLGVSVMLCITITNCHTCYIEQCRRFQNDDVIQHVYHILILQITCSLYSRLDQILYKLTS